MLSIVKYSQAKQAANARYDAKTYKRYGLYLRQDEDTDIIQSIEAAKDRGESLRDWLRDIFEGNK